MARKILFTSCIIQMMALTGYITLTFSKWCPTPTARGDIAECSLDFTEFAPWRYIGEFFILLSANFCLLCAVKDVEETKRPQKKQMLTGWLNIIGLYTLTYYGYMVFQVDWKSWSVPDLDKIQLTFVVWNLVTFMFVQDYENECQPEECNCVDEDIKCDKHANPETTQMTEMTENTLYAPSNV